LHFLSTAEKAAEARRRSPLPPTSYQPFAGSKFAQTLVTHVSASSMSLSNNSFGRSILPPYHPWRRTIFESLPTMAAPKLLVFSFALHPLSFLESQSLEKF